MIEDAEIALRRRVAFVCKRLEAGGYGRIVASRCLSDLNRAIRSRLRPTGGAWRTSRQKYSEPQMAELPLEKLAPAHRPLPQNEHTSATTDVGNRSVSIVAGSSAIQSRLGRSFAAPLVSRESTTNVVGNKMPGCELGRSAQGLGRNRPQMWES